MLWLGLLRSGWKNNGMRWDMWVRFKGTEKAPPLLPCKSSVLLLPFLARGPKQEEGQESITEPSFITVQVPCDIFWRNSLSCLDPSQHAKELPGAIPGVSCTGE